MDINDTPPTTPTSAPAHYGPPPGWRPMSAWALVAGVVSIVMAGTAVAVGYWWLAVVCMLLCALAMRSAKPARYRGRWIAILGLILSGLGAAYAFYMQHTMYAVAEDPAQAVLEVLSDGTLSDTERRTQLEGWLHPESLAAGALARTLEDYTVLEARMGAWKGDVSAGTLFSSYLPIFMGPGEAVVDVTDPSKSAPGVTKKPRIYWTAATFERGTVHVALRLHASIPVEEAAVMLSGSTEPQPIYEAVTYFTEPQWIRRGPAPAPEPGTVPERDVPEGEEDGER